MLLIIRHHYNNDVIFIPINRKLVTLTKNYHVNIIQKTITAQAQRRIITQIWAKRIPLIGNESICRPSGAHNDLFLGFYKYCAPNGALLVPEGRYIYRKKK